MICLAFKYFIFGGFLFFFSISYFRFWNDVFKILELDEAKALIKELEDKVELLTDELKKYKQLNRKKEE